MNLLSTSIMLKSIEKNSKSTGRGGYTQKQTNKPSQEDYFLTDCKQIIAECVKMPNMEGQTVPVESKTKTWRNSNTKNHSITFININPDGIKLEGVSFDTSKYSAIGVIDRFNIFGLDAKTGNLEVMTVDGQYNYGPHDDYIGYYNIVEFGKSKEHHTSALRVNSSVVQDENNIQHKNSHLENFSYDSKDFDELMSLITYIRERYNNLSKAENQEEPANQPEA